jgi:ATP-binding cassette, subfamily C, bacterial PrsD
MRRIMWAVRSDAVPDVRPGAASLGRVRGALIGAAAFGCVINILALAGPFFMLEVYDRVLPSRSVPTLVALLLLVLVLYAFSGILDVVRARIMARVAAAVDLALSGRVFAAIAGAPLRARIGGDVLRPARDLEQIRSFLGGAGPAALFDLPWMAFYLAVCFLIHPLIGWLTAAGVAVLVALTLVTDLRTRHLTRAAAAAAARRNLHGEAAHRNAEAIAAMGMGRHAGEQWESANAEHDRLQRQASDIAGALSGASRTLRYILQSGVLALGAYLVIRQEMTPGMIVAGSILVTRAMAPAELAIANWKGFLAARQSWRRLRELLELFPEEEARTALPPPAASLGVEAVSVAPPGERRPVVHNVTFRVAAGTAIGVVGPNASGKSSLARALVGVWPVLQGHVRLDGAGLDRWSAAERGRHIGYLPQDVELLPGSVARNIARFDPAASDADVVAAAKAAGVHDLVLRLPDGYETEAGEGGPLSAGQRQRIALARALYRDPFLVVLDEPNSGLDAEGEEALASAIGGVRRRGGIAVVVAHRPGVLVALDLVLVMERGTMKAFGPKEAVLSRTKPPSSPPSPPPSAPPLKLVDKEGTP